MKLKTIKTKVNTKSTKTCFCFLVSVELTSSSYSFRVLLFWLCFAFSPYFILNCSFAAPHWQCVIAHAIASAASSGFGISFIPKSSFTIC